ncbi:hypothetical protein CIPAW_11G043900 [Carya illinoinensis]|uniref:Uncharacterized protein n=1 Tax=Carya illinoinensis TaxID=32201 RepID=A0A8T1NV33_CARIL|nr:hypothetical protein CIPAW_11G043900 [Carya illinoinensis]
MDTSENANLDSKTPLIEVGHREDETKESGGHWWEKVLEVEEAKKQALFSLPMILTNVFYYLITLVSVMFASHLGDSELAGATLANSWATVTSFAFMVGLSGALETLCGQGFGAKLYGMLGIYLQASCIISFIFSIIISIIWFYTEPILIFLHQDTEIAKTAALYLKFLIPGLLAYGFLQNILSVNTETVAYMITYGLSAASSTRVSNELGAGNPNQAKSAMAVTLKLSVFLALTVVLALCLGNNIWAGFFSDSPTIILEFASMTPLLPVSIFADSVQGVLSGVARGCGWQHLAVYANLATFYFIGVPIAIFLGF